MTIVAFLRDNVTDRGVLAVLDNYEILSRGADRHPALRERVEEYELFVLPFLALSYADHADYDEVWRP